MNQATRRKVKQKAFKLTKEILLLVLETPGELVDIFTDHRSYTGRLFPKQQVTLAQINRTVRDLEKQRLIRKKENRKKIVYEVTDLGQARILKWNYKRKPKQERRDGLSTIVIFDIPETKKKSRDFLRRFLKDNGFTQLQESVFIGRFWLLREFNELLKELHVEEHVTVLEGRIPRYTT